MNPRSVYYARMRILGQLPSNALSPVVLLGDNLELVPRSLPIQLIYDSTSLRGLPEPRWSKRNPTAHKTSSLKPAKLASIWARTAGLRSYVCKLLRLSGALSRSTFFLAILSCHLKQWSGSFNRFKRSQRFRPTPFTNPQVQSSGNGAAQPPLPRILSRWPFGHRSWPTVAIW